MKVYLKDDLNNLNSSQKETVLKAEKTFIVSGEGADLKAFCLADLVVAVIGKVKEPKVKVLGAKKGKKTK
jgi:hypothetical protein